MTEKEINEALIWIFDNFPARIVFELGFKPPKWKKHWKTRQEAIAAIKALLEEEFGEQYGQAKEDYSKWK